MYQFMKKYSKSKEDVLNELDNYNRTLTKILEDEQDIIDEAEAVSLLGEVDRIAKSKDELSKIRDRRM